MILHIELGTGGAYESNSLIACMGVRVCAVTA